MAVKHAFTSAKSDGADATLVQPGDWNADHTGTNAHVLDSADHTVSGQTAGTFMRAQSATTYDFEAIPFSVGALIDGGGSAVSTGFKMVWRAPFACTVTNVRGHVDTGTTTQVNARRNQTSDFLATDLTINSANAWVDGGSVQNTAIAAGDDIEVEIAVAGTATEVNIQVDLTRP